MKDLVGAVAAFHRSILGLHPPAVPTRLLPTRKEWAVTAMLEELVEFRDAEVIEEEADALADLVYFALGRADEMGFDMRPVFAEVHAKNMQKKRGEQSKRPGSMGFDAIKPAGWLSPVHNLQPVASRPWPKILVIGHAQHGKDTVCEMLRDKYAFRFTSSSMFCAEHIIMPMFKPGVYATPYDCYKDRSNYRAFWYSAIQRYLSKDAARLGRAIFEQNDIYCGVRSETELNGIVQARLADHVIWVDASKRKPLESPESCTVHPLMANIVIDNNGTHEELVEEVDYVARLIMGDN